MADYVSPLLYNLITIKQVVDFETGEIIFVPKMDQLDIISD
jgi:hypothetical protein